MNCAEQISESRSQIIRVRYYGGTHIATGGWKRASCTAGEYSAAFTLARKLFPRKTFTVSEHGHGNNRFYRAEASR